MTAVSRLGRQIAEVTAVLRANRAPLAAEGGVLVPAERPADPYRVLDDLMAVVEQLCPRWPERDVFRNESHNLL